MMLEVGYTPPGGGGIMLPLGANSDATLRRPPALVMESDVTPVVAGGASPGWVSGSLASLAASALAICIFDLGPNWDQYSLASITVLSTSPSSGLSAVQVSGSATPTSQSSRRMKEAFSAVVGTIYAALTTAGGPQSFQVRPIGRFVVVVATNADATNAQGAASKIVLAAYPS